MNQLGYHPSSSTSSSFKMVCQRLLIRLATEMQRDEKKKKSICKPTLFNHENIFHEIIGKIGWIKWPKIIETSLKAYSSVVIILMCVTFWIRVCFGKYPRALTFDHMSSQWYLVGPISKIFMEVFSSQHFSSIANFDSAPKKCNSTVDNLLSWRWLTFLLAFIIMCAFWKTNFHSHKIKQQ